LLIESSQKKSVTSETCQSTTAKSPRLHFPEDTSHVVPSGQQCFPSVQQTACKTIKLINHGSTFSIIDEFKVKSQTMTTPTFENDGYLHISFALLYSLLQKRLLTCTRLKLCLTQVLFNKRRMQVKCISLFNL
jgi:hypothetical protein